MKTVSIMEAQHNLSRVLKAVETGEAIGITRRKVLVARILPPEPPADQQMPDFATRAANTWKNQSTGDTDVLLDASRGER